MKTQFKLSKLLCTLIVGLFLLPTANAQILKKLTKRAEKTVERKLEQKTERETAKAMDSILDPNEKTMNKQSPNETSQKPNDRIKQTSPDAVEDSDVANDNQNISENLEVYSKFDFVPGDKILFFDDFSQDFIGDFPSKWNTNGSGEVIKLNKAEGNWFEFKPGYKILYIPILNTKLPEEYTIEFDLVTDGLDKKTTSTAILNITLDESSTFNVGKSYSFVNLPFGQYGAFGIRVKSIQNNNVLINSVLTADIRDEVKNMPHISMAVNKKRFRLWINEVKYVDIPQFVPDGNILTTLKFNLQNFKDGKERLFIQNMKIAEGGLDLRRTLMTDGRVSTNGILFDSGSANIKPQSLGIVTQISQVLMQDENIKLNIVGHTDSDGNDEANLKLSKARAEAVKDALINIYNVSANRLQTDGKGESVPVADNASPDGKAQNRRVEFIKI
jgi:outer membrane protein OmpA-like peptidoglycan-associated protein